MKEKVIIASEYADDDSLNDFIHTLPSSFGQCPEVLWSGRNEVRALSLHSGRQIVVKRFKTPMLIQQLGYLFRTHKARKAYLNAQELLRRGIDTPHPVACILHYRQCLIHDAYYISLRNDNPPIEDLLYRDDWDEDLARAFALFAATLHRRGILHHDLNDTNVRYARNADGEYLFSLIDINRMSFYDRLEDIPMKERIENITRFTNRAKLFEYVAREYALSFGLDITTWLPRAVRQKKRHDINRYRRKRLVHPLRYRK